MNVRRPVVEQEKERFSPLERLLLGLENADKEMFAAAEEAGRRTAMEMERRILERVFYYERIER